MCFAPQPSQECEAVSQGRKLGDLGVFRDGKGWERERDTMGREQLFLATAERK